MNAIKRYLGIIWMVSGPAILLFMIMEAHKKIYSVSGSNNDILQWGIIIGIFIPIAFGFVVFGYYSWKGEYDVAE